MRRAPSGPTASRARNPRKGWAAPARSRAAPAPAGPGRPRDSGPDTAAPCAAPRAALLPVELEPHASAGPLAPEAPALRDLVDELEPASALVVPVGFAPVGKPAAPVVDHVHVHHRAAAGHRSEE